MKFCRILVICLTLAMSSCSSERSSNEESKNKPVASQLVEILHKEDVGDYSNIHFLLLKDINSESEITQIAKLNCGDKCNQLYFWKDKKAYELLQFKRQNYYSLNPQNKIQKDWLKKNWIFICENLKYEYSQGEISTFPYFDSKYYELGGKLKKNRP